MTLNAVSLKGGLRQLPHSPPKKVIPNIDHCVPPKKVSRATG